MKLPSWASFNSLGALRFRLQMRSSRWVYIGLGVFFLVLIGYGLFEARGFLAGPAIIISPRVLTTGDPLIKVSGTALRIATLSMDGKDIPVSEGGVFEESYVLTPGYNRIALDAKDKYGKSAERVIEVMYAPATTSLAGDRADTSATPGASATTDWIPLSSQSNKRYALVNGVIAYNSPIGSSTTPTNPAADVSSFVVSVISPIYAKDDRSVYCLGNAVPNADNKTFTALPGALLPGTSKYSAYAKDANMVYERCEPIAGANATTFKVLKTSGNEWSLYAEDGKTIYYVATSGVITVANADPATFVLLNTSKQCGPGCMYDAADATHKYLAGKVVQ